MDNFDNSSKYFRESFKGFNKDDVIQFVTKLIKEYSESEETYKEEIAKSTEAVIKKSEEIVELEKTINTLKANSQDKTNEEELNNQIASLNDQLKDSDNKLREAETKLKNAGTKVPEGMENRVKEAETRYNATKLKLREVEITLQDAENDKQFLLDVIKKFELETGVRVREVCDEQSLAAQKVSFENNMIDMAEASKSIIALEASIAALKKEKEEMNRINIELHNQADNFSVKEEKVYAKITAELGNVIYSANRTAEDIMNKATTDAENIMNTATTEADEIMSKTTAEANEIMSRTTTEANEIMSKTTSDAEYLINKTTAEANDIMNNATAEADDMMNKTKIERAMFYDERDKEIFKIKESLKTIQQSCGIISGKFKDSYETFAGDLVRIEQLIDETHNKF